jgi:hypothetical protein
MGEQATELGERTYKAAMESIQQSVRAAAALLTDWLSVLRCNLLQLSKAPAAAPFVLSVPPDLKPSLLLRRRSEQCNAWSGKVQQQGRGAWGVGGGGRQVLPGGGGPCTLFQPLRLQAAVTIASGNSMGAGAGQEHLQVILWCCWGQRAASSRNRHARS